MEAVLRRQLETAVVAGMEQASRDVMQWGEDDCGLWAANIIHSVLPYDPAQECRGRYKTRNGARRALGPKGLKGRLQRAARRHGWKRIEPKWAKPGDVGLAWTAIDVPGWHWEKDEETLERRKVRCTVQKMVLATVICRAPGWFVGRNERGFTALVAKDVVTVWCILDDLQHGKRVNLPRISTRPSMVPTSAACHEPISLTILSALAIEATVTAIAVTNFIVMTALSVGVSMVTSMLQPQSGGGGAGSLADTSPVRGAQITERQSIPFKRAIFGSAYVGGAMFFEQVKAPYLTVGVLVNYGEIAGVDKVFIATDQLSFSSITPNTIFTPIGVDGQPNYPNRLRMSLRYGETDQAVDPLILARYPDVGTEFRQRGIATVVYEYHYGTDQVDFLATWGQVSRPNAFLVVRGVKCYDPRKASHNIDDESTWEWTNNATLVQTYYLTREWGGRIPIRKVRWDKIAASADYDDELIGTNTPGELIKRHTIDGVVTLSQRPYDVMQTLLTANRGMVLESAGQIWIESSKPKVSIATIHDRILASGIKYQSARPKRDFINKLQVRFVAPNQDYQVVDGPVLNRTDWQTIDGEVLPATLALNYTQDHRRAQRLQKAYMASARLGRTINCAVDISLMAIAEDELLGSVVTFDSQLFSLVNREYLVTSVGISEDYTTLSLALTEYDSSIETDWNPETDEQPFELTPINVS